MQYAYYAIYGLSTIGICLSIMYNSFALAVFCFVTCIVGVIAEARDNRDKWPIVGSTEYTEIVHKMHDAILKGKEEAMRK